MKIKQKKKQRKMKKRNQKYPVYRVYINPSSFCATLYVVYCTHILYHSFCSVILVQRSKMLWFKFKLTSFNLDLLQKNQNDSEQQKQYKQQQQ